MAKNGRLRVRMETKRVREVEILADMLGETKSEFLRAAIDNHMHHRFMHLSEAEREELQARLDDE